MSTSLAQHHVHCYQAFTRISAELPVSIAHHDSLQDQFDKYKLWAGNVGAAHSGKTYQLSLDYRLREVPFYKEQACKLLQILARQTNRTADILAGSRTPFEQLSPGSDSDTTSCTSPVEEDSPWEFSSDFEAEVGILSSLPLLLRLLALPGCENRESGDMYSQTWNVKTYGTAGEERIWRFVHSMDQNYVTVAWAAKKRGPDWASLSSFMAIRRRKVKLSTDTYHNRAGLFIASQPPKGLEITIVVRNLPGDPAFHTSASPWTDTIRLGIVSPARVEDTSADYVTAASFP